MPKDRQKVKLLTVLKVFERETDENHPLSADRIAELVGTYSHIHANRKGVYDDISAINDFYYTTSKDDNCPQVELKHGRGEGKGYYLANRPFSTSDVKLMVDAIESSKYLTLPKTLDLVEKLEGLLPKTQARDVRAQVVIFDRVKNMNSKIHESLNTISTAIAHNRQIQYKYFDYDYLKQRVYRKNGAFYQVSPYDLVYTDDNYYLVGLNEKLESRTYRVDRMASVEMLSIPRNGKEEFGDPDKAKLRLQKSTFGMFTGKIEAVTLVFRKVIMNPIIDRFGSDVFMTKVDDEHYQISVPVAISQQFFGWIFGLGDMITITAPAHIREQYMKRMLDIHKRYE